LKTPVVSVGRKYIVSKGWEGFGDRLQCLSYCINSALRYNRSIYVDWTDTVWGEGFYRYFHFVDLPFVESDKDIPVSSSVYPEFWKNKLMLPANSWVYDMREALAFEPQKSLHYEDVWVHPGIGYREYDFYQLPKNLRLNADVAEEIRSRLVEFDLPIVHLRGTDRAVSEEKWAELREKAPVAWVLSEDKALIDRWMQESPESKVFSSAKEGVTHFSTDVDKHEMNLAVLTDFFTIASAKDAYALNDGSLFFSMARKFGGCGGVRPVLGRFPFSAKSVCNVTDKPIFVSFYTTNGKYPELAYKLMRSLKAHNLDHDIEELPPFESWTKTTAFKATFIKRKLLQYNRPVIWIDCDCEILQYPELLMGDSEFAAVNWFAVQGHHLDGKIPYDADTDKGFFTGMLSKWALTTLPLIDQWQGGIDVLTNHNEDQVLSITWNKEDRRSISRTWLPTNYLSGLFSVDDPVIRTEFAPYADIAARELMWQRSNGLTGDSPSKSPA